MAIAGLAFQVLHFAEHAAQLGYWFLNPLEKPWLTPRAVGGRDALVAGGDPVLGTELLHLVGNSVFFGGVVAMCLVVLCKRRSVGDSRHLSAGQCVGKVSTSRARRLTLTLVIFGNAIGISTMFGLLGNGPFGGGYRIWRHYLINLVATIYAVKALKEFKEESQFNPDLDLVDPDLEPVSA